MLGLSVVNDWGSFGERAEIRAFDALVVDAIIDAGEARIDAANRLARRWVSGFEPKLILRRDPDGSVTIVGLGVAGDPTDTVVIPSA